MRLFLAVDVHETVRRRAEALRQELLDRHGATAARGLRWVRSDQLHLTLRFLGEVASPLAEAVIDACGGTLAFHAFDLELDAPAWLPPVGAPRVLMLPARGGGDALARLKQVVGERLPAGVPPDDPRPFTPHLTLARVREEFRREVRAVARDAAFLPAEPVTTRVTHVALVESRLSPRGPEYRERARLVLAGDA